MFFRIGSFEVFTEPTGPGFSFFGFDHIKRSETDREYLFLRQSIVISRVAPRSLAAVICEWTHGLLNCLGWDVFTTPERHALHLRAGQHGFWNLEMERGAHGFEFWGFGRYVLISVVARKDRQAGRR